MSNPLYHRYSYRLWATLDDLCPADQKQAADCPLKFLRELTPAQRMEWFRAQTDDSVLIELAAHHQKCPCRKKSPDDNPA